MLSGPRLSLNLNKVALLRNSRHTGVPDVLRFAKLARAAGADGITVHPRPDNRHIRHGRLGCCRAHAPVATSLRAYVEGCPDERLLDIVLAVQPEHQVCCSAGQDGFGRMYAPGLTRVAVLSKWLRLELLSRHTGDGHQPLGRQLHGNISVAEGDILHRSVETSHLIAFHGSA